MARSGGDNLREFIITWRIENFSYSWHKWEEAIFSPYFCADTFQSTKWILTVYPRGTNDTENISCVLIRTSDGPVEITLNIEISFLGIEGSALARKDLIDQLFIRGSERYFDSFVTQDEVFAEKNAEFLPEGVLTVRCRLWKKDEDVIEPEQLFARTRLEVVRKWISGTVDIFNSTSTCTARSIRITSVKEEKNQFRMNLELIDKTNGDQNLMLQIIFPENQLKKSSTCKVYLLDAEANKLECGKSETDFEEQKDWEFMLLPTKWKLLTKKRLYLPNNILTLECEIVLTTGLASEELQDNANELSSSLNPISNVDKFGDLVSPSSALIDLGILYRNQVLCDVTLKTNNEAFPAHAVILSARSSVFKAMFTNDMKEKRDNCVNISDFDSETVRNLLLYAYTDTTSDLKWNTALQLYAAADKYAIISLKEKCSTFLKESVCTSKACEVLVLADMHQDVQLKKFMQNYISQKYDKVFSSSEWKDMEQKNPQLLIETLIQMYTNVKAF